MLLCQLSGTPKVVAYVISSRCRCRRCRRVNVVVCFCLAEAYKEFRMISMVAGGAALSSCSRRGVTIRPANDLPLAFSYTAVQSPKQTGKNSCRSDCLNENTQTEKSHDGDFVSIWACSTKSNHSFLLCLRTVVSPPSTTCRHRVASCRHLFLHLGV